MRTLFMTTAFLLCSSIALAVLQIGLWLITNGWPTGGMFVNAAGGWVLFHGCRTYYLVMSPDFTDDEESLYGPED